jgi:hypothetical protein
VDFRVIDRLTSSSLKNKFKPYFRSIILKNQVSFGCYQQNFDKGIKAISKKEFLTFFAKSEENR